MLFRRCLILLMILPALVVGQDFKASIAAGVDLILYETFTVVRGTVITNSDQPINKEAFYSEIKTSIVREMEERGYRYLDEADSAQLVVSYVIETTVKLDIQQQGRLAQQVVVTTPAMADQSQAWSREFTQGTLILEIEDRERSVSVWSAEGVMDISRARGGSLLDNAVRSAFRKFPSKTDKGKKKRG